MNLIKIIGIAIVVGLIVFGGFHVGQRNSNSNANIFISTAQARVGRPLTPVSIAGTARRTSRRVSRRN
jgi:hypothetical protein